MKNLVIINHGNRNYYPKSTCFFLIFLGMLLSFSMQLKAQGNLLIYPKRLVFEGAKKSQTLNLANTGKDTVRYLISVVQTRMKENGSFEVISVPDSGQHFADKNFRFFPRNVVLAPNEAQSIKIQLTNTSTLEPGEYRSHLYFRAEPDKKPLGEEETTKDTTAIAVRLTAVFGISIPVIIRVGEPVTNVSITNPLLKWQKDSVPSLDMAFNRSGNMSVYGDIAVTHISPAGKITPVTTIKGVAVYAPNAIRYFSLPLDKNKGVDYRTGRLHITYLTPAEAKGLLIAEAEMILL